MISPNVVILTLDELRAREAKAFQRGVERGRFEALASGIEAASADETRSGSAEGESPAPEGGDAR